MKNLFVYILWILFCALLFAALRGADDPALPAGRITEREAVESAAASLEALGREGVWREVHAAWSPAGELGDEARWVVLFAQRTPQGRQEALVIEVNGGSGKPIRVRRPGSGMQNG